MLKPKTDQSEKTGKVSYGDFTCLFVLYIFSRNGLKRSKFLNMVVVLTS